MKIALQAEVLKNKLSFINHAISTKQQLPILSHILLSAKDSILTINATDLEIGIQVQLPVDIHEEGSIALPARTFSELISSLSSDVITIESKENSVNVTTKKTKSTFQTMPPTDFPRLFEEKGTLIATIDPEELKKELNAVIFAASSDISRANLSGVLVEQEAKGFLLVATDGFRLSLKHYTFGKEDKVQLIEGETSMIVPARVFREALSMKEEKGKLFFYVSPLRNQIILEQGSSILIGRLVEAEFPNYERIIPGDFSVRASFDREEMTKAVRICSIFARDVMNIIKLSLKEGKIIVSAGENTVEVDSLVKGEENEIAFNARYLLDVLQNIPSENIEFEMTGPLNPGVFKTQNDESFLHLIMPIKVQQ